jgi:gamma-glutamylcyclotransferase (GGCT)/AIG2-like uncharacterized protein YtfP
VTAILFFYGTLKRGGRNHHFLAGQTFLGEAHTLPRYRLYDLGPHPALVEAEHGAVVRGEVWAVDAATLARLDEFEGVPDWFDRRPIQLADAPAGAEAYFYRGDVTSGRDCGGVWPPSA